MLRIGNGYDIHRLTKGKYITLGGIKIPCSYSIEAHSDGDVVIHSLIDALLGSVCKKDIGFHFPPSSDKYKNIESKLLLLETLKIIGNIEIYNVDITIILESPKLKDYIDLIRENLASLLNIEINQISVKAKTNEKCDSIGNKKAVVSHCTLLLNTL